MFDLIGLDWGSKRFGLAFGSSETKLVIPCNYNCPSAKIFEIIAREIKTREIKKIIIGYPSNFFGKDTQVTQKIKKFIKSLKAGDFIKDIEVVFFDERGSTKEAKKYLPQKDKDSINHLAAVKILTDYLTY